MEKRQAKTQRNYRTRLLIQVGGLFQKAGLLEPLGLTETSDLEKGGRTTADITATILGMCLEMKDHMTGDEMDLKLGEWRVRGKDAFKKDRRN